MKERGSEKDAEKTSIGLEAFADNYVETNINFKLKDAGYSLTFAELCQANSVDIPQKYVDFISRSLNIDINVRPDSFEELV
jgi:hypothetical protein